MTQQRTYSLVARSLHWLIAILIFWAIALGLIAEELPASPEKIQLFVIHKSVGITVLVLTLVRLGWRVASPPPSLGLGKKEEQLASAGHWGLYALMLSVPLSGWLLNSAAGYPFAWFNLFSVPHIPGVDEGAKGVFAGAHVVLFYVLALMVIGHVVMLFVHKVAHGMNLLPRMLPGKTTWLACLLVLVLAYLVGYTINKANTAEENEVFARGSEHMQLPAQQSAQAHSDSPLWELVSSKDNFTFSNAYAGESFTGTIADFTPTIYFTPAHPEQGLLDVIIATGSISTFNTDWDATLKGSQWFATEAYPAAHYISKQITQTDEGYVADGELTLKGLTMPVTVRFNWKPLENGTVAFTGSAVLDRRDFEIGSGSWATDSSVDFEVKLHINLKLKRVE